MKAKNGLIIQRIDDDYYLIDSGEVLPRFNGMIKLNETSHFVVEKLMEKELTLDELYNLILAEYSTTLEELNNTIPPVIEQLKKVNIILD